MLSLSSKIEDISKVGPAYLKKLHKLNIKSVRDLFFHFPHRYEDFSQTVPISQLKEGQKATVQGEIVDIKNIRIPYQRIKRKLILTEALIKDDTGSIKVVWYNQPYLTQSLKKGRVISLSGKLTFSKKTLCLSNPAYELAKLDTVHTGRLVPVYHETEGLSSRYIRYIIKPITYLTDHFTDFLPDGIKKKFELLNLSEAIKQIHFPENLSFAQKARQRLSFDELFLIQLTTLLQKRRYNKEKSISVEFNQKLIKSFVKSLPFKLTNDQRLAAWEIFQDMSKNQPMNRLMNGDVGSGKTIVALMAALETAKAGYQVALMAPTEILARQHYESFVNFLKKQKLTVGLLTGTDKDISSKEKITKPQLKKEILNGNVDIIIGTHALIQENMSFKNLALAIIDEQHRFGVAQRAALQKKIYNMEDGLPTIPHLLSMTATPIPRTLALTIYGDLDISLIKELPKGRQKIITELVTPDKRQEAYDFITKQIKKKRQVFVICPLIDESEKLDVKSVSQEHEMLSKEIFPHFQTDMLHGKLKPKEKEKIMKDFKDGKTDILVSTSVIEVGVDIPNATVMIIEGADRFGLSQLHQFRGRIGRGKHQSYCFLFTDSETQKTDERLKAIIKAKDGFELAEKDLKLRGPGNFIGTRQWGLPDLAMASLDDLELIKKSRQAANLVIENEMINPDMEKRIENFHQDIHLE